MLIGLSFFTDIAITKATRMENAADISFVFYILYDAGKLWRSKALNWPGYQEFGDYSVRSQVSNS